MDPDPAPDPDLASTSNKISGKNLDFYSFVTSLKLVISENRCKCTYG
jgi:hypothetical protein